LVCAAFRNALDWVRSRTTVGFYYRLPEADRPPPSSPEEVTVHEAGLRDLLMAWPLGSSEAKEFLPTAYSRLVSGDRCFLLKSYDEIAAIGWVTHGSPMPVHEIRAVLTFEEGEACLYDVQVFPAFRGRRMYVQLLTAIIDMLGERTAFIFADLQN